MKRLFFIYFLIAFSMLNTNAETPDSLLQIINSPKNDTNKIKAYLDISKIYIRKNLDSALMFSQKALQLSSSLKEDNWKANAMKLIGVIFYYSQTADSALIYFSKAKELYEKTGNFEKAYQMSNNIGVIYKMKGEYLKALEIYEKTIDDIKKQNKYFNSLATFYTNAANIYQAQGNQQKAIEYYFNSLKILDSLGEKSPEYKNLIFSIYMNLGVIFNQQKDFDNALKYYNKALLEAEKNNDNGHIAETYINIGVLYSDKNKFDSAIIYYRKALPLLEFKGKKATVYMNIGDAFNALQQIDSAYIYLDKAKKIYLDTKDKRGYALTLSTIGQTHYIAGKYSQSVKVLEEAYAIADSVGDLNVLKNITDWLSRAYAANGQYKQAYEMHKKFKFFNDSIYNKQNERKLVTMSMQYEFERKQKEQELQYQAKIQKQRLISYFGLSITLLLIVVIIFVYRAFRIKKQANKLLKIKNSEILQQKAEIEAQRDEIEAQKNQIEKQSKEIEKQRDIALKQKKNIEDSIHYAMRIQQAVMPDLQFLKKFLTDYFIFFKPRDIVSGDFYWAVRRKNKLVITIGDCTGHGVPGAFMSLLIISFLKEIVSDTQELEPNIILQKLKEKVIISLKQKDDPFSSRDGMDAALVVYDIDTHILKYSGAYNPLYIIRNNDQLKYSSENPVQIIEDKNKFLYEFKADKMPIGFNFLKNKNFTTAQIQLEKDDMFYMFSDGFPSLYNYEKNIKFTTKRFKKLILDISNLQFEEQKQQLQKVFDEWTSNQKQIDDVLVGGFKI